MGRRRRKEASLIDLVPPIAGLIALGFFFSPAFRQLMGALLYFVVIALVLVVIGLVMRAIWRRSQNNAETDRFNPPPKPVGGSPVYRTAHEIEKIPNVHRRFERAVRVQEASVKLDWSQELLSKLEWKRFEDVVAAYSRELGYEAKTTRIGPDGGVDVQLFKDGQPNPIMIIQCKAWDAYKVGVKPVRELYGVMAADKVANGAFFTTGDFTSEAEEWAREKNLDLVNGREFLGRIRQLMPDQQEKLLATATEGDYTTPTCPRCGIKMIERTAGKGRSEGNSFWGCRNYPRCRQTFKADRAS